MEQRDQKNIVAPDGILLLDKPAGRTSHDCVNEIRRLYGTKKVGHAGTLDPMATGLLVVLLGRAAKASDCMTEKDKHYQAILQLGLTTDTQDITGRVLSKSTAPLPDEQTVKDTAALRRATANTADVFCVEDSWKEAGRSGTAADYR